MPAYLKLDGFTGNVTKGPYKGWIELTNYHWGFSVPVNTTVGSANNRVTSGQVTPGDLHFSKRQCQSSAKFMLEGMKASNIGKATLAVTMPTANGAQDKYMEFDLHECITSQYQTSGSASDHDPTESMAMNFTKIEISQFSRDAQGNPLPAQRGSTDFTTGNIA